jgi:hypothetical protein
MDVPRSTEFPMGVIGKPQREIHIPVTEPTPAVPITQPVPVPEPASAPTEPAREPVPAGTR